MFEVNVTINCPDLLKAATLLANALGGTEIKEPAVVSSATAAPVVTAPAVPVNTATTNPISGQSFSHSTPMNCPSNTPSVTNVPLAQAPVFTLEQISKAGADLVTVQPAKMQELMGLMAQFGVQTVNALKPDQLGAFATALRGMGAQI